MALDLRDLARRAADLGGEEAIASVSLRREVSVRCGPAGALLPPRRTFDLLVRLLVRDGAGRFGVARCSTSQTPEQLITLAERAHENAALSTTDLSPLPEPADGPQHGGFDARTADLDVAFGAARARDAASQIGGDPALSRAALWRAEVVDLVVASSSGALATDRRTGVQLVVSAADVDGRVAACAQAGGVIADGIDAYRAGLRATPAGESFARAGAAEFRSPADAVVLFPPALAPLLEAFAGMACTGHAVATGLSPFTGRAGHRVAAPDVTLVDDPSSTATLARSIDVEGVSAEAVVLVDGGLAGEVVHDTASADEAGTRSTGHAAELGGGSSGAVPRNLVMASGTQDVADLIAFAGHGTVIGAVTNVQLAGPGSTRFTAVGRGAYSVAGGEPVAMLGDVVLVGDLTDVLAGIDAMSAATELVATLDRLPERTRATTCPAVVTTGVAVVVS